ncbi:DUF4230 domain-containing protein [Chitinophaga sp. SYP-B3965]|uniref:DUF4230 domain-containing protein n=1 Tax=Chitinophaga sp. SYP-B3965 TaxID=2663120 RepID=UPI001299FCCC|nr:DUF4230 domain-containing protein [Chitinophaga sp. SYP-B3965]MRG48496.1 DUF4230 domain-containing protein [Chitinophaga sp. SYP-B3965]
MKKIIQWIVVILLIVFIFWLGQWFGSKKVNQSILSNSLIVREIAELASLEVQGNASIKRSNVENNGDWTDNLKKVFAENTIWVTVPYTAKYGVDTDEKNFTVTLKEKRVIVQLPAPQLLSYELRLNQMETANKKGWFMPSNDETYTDVQKKLYETSREQLTENNIYLEKSKEKIRQIIGTYYKPLGYEVEVKFGNEPGKVLKLN